MKTGGGCPLTPTAYFLVSNPLSIVLVYDNLCEIIYFPIARLSARNGMIGHPISKSS